MFRPWPAARWRWPQALGVRHRAHQADIRGREGVRLPQLPHRDVLRGPFADARQGPQLRDRFLQAAAGGEDVRVGHHRRRDRQQRRATASRHAHGGRIGAGQRRRIGEDVGQGAVRLAQRFAEAGHQRAGQADRAGHGDLLPEHRAHRQFEAVPGAGDAQSRPSGDQRREGGVLDQLQRDGVGVGGQVEHPAQAGDDLRQGGEFWKPHGRVQGVAAGRADGDGALLAVQADGAAIGVALDGFDPGDGAGAEKTEHGGPVVGGTVAQQQADLAVRAGRDVSARRIGAARSGGRRNSAWNVSLNRRRLPKPAAMAISVIGRRVSWINCLASSTRRLCATAMGEAPRCCWNSRRSCRSPTPTRLAEVIDGGLIQRAQFDQSEGAGDGVGGAAPGAEVGGGFRAAAQAGAEPGLVRRGGGGEEDDVLRTRRAGGADRAAVDAGGFDAGEQAAVEAGVADGHRAVAGVVVEIEGVGRGHRYGPAGSRRPSGLCWARQARASASVMSRPLNCGDIRQPAVGRSGHFRT